MKKHILLSSDDPGVGGVAQYNHALVYGLAKLGYRITYLQPEAYDDNLIIQQQELDIQHLLLDEQTSQKLPQIWDEINNKPDLIICSNSNPFSNFGIKHLAIQLGIPYIVVEGLVEPHLADQFAQHLDELSHHYSQARSVIAVSYDNLDLLHKLFKLPKNLGQVIYYGRSSEYFTDCNLDERGRLREKLSIPKDAVVCFTAARIEPRKGYQYQLDAIKQLMQTPEWEKLYFVWAGAGIFAPQLEIQFKEVVEELGITDKVIFIGQRSDIANWLNIADIFVFPSQLEGMPICIMEAMAKGLPVIASSVSGIPEELGNTGKLLTDPKIEPQATVTELVNTVQRWVIDSQLRESIGQTCKQRAKKMFREERMIDQTVEIIEKAMLPNCDYISPDFQIVKPDVAFPNMVVGDAKTCAWQYLRREIPHNWYVDKRKPTIGFLSRDEAHILYNTALKFKGKKALEIGCWLGWSACHIALAGVELDIVDPLLAQEDVRASVSDSLKAANVFQLTNLVGGYSPAAVEELATQLERKWSLIFIDGNHEAPGPLDDAIICEQLAEDDALVLFHDLSSPDVAQGLDYFREKGWNTMVYQTMQIMGVAWRGNIEPVKHQPDPKVNWYLPKHLSGYCVSGLSIQKPIDEFTKILNIVRPYTLLSEERLFSLYSLAREICEEDIPGNFVECGSYKGGAAALLGIVIQRYSKRLRSLYAFDTFEGMPDPTQFDHHQGIPANSTGFGVGTLKAPIAENLDFVCKLLKVEEIVIPVKGLFADTLPEYKSRIANIAFLHADGDWYKSTMDIFHNLYDNVVVNGFIQVDDYGHWEGCRKAIHEFEILKGEKFNLHQIDYTGVWFEKSNPNMQKKASFIILVDGVFFQLYKTGIARVWKSLLEEWAGTDFAKHIVVLDRVGTAPKIPGIRYRATSAFDFNDRESEPAMLQQICDEENADVFISTYYTTPITTASVFMAYDMIPEVFDWDLRHPMWQQKHDGIQHASNYIAISQNTANDLTKLFPDISPESVHVAHCGVSKAFSPAKIEEINSFKFKYGISKPYFLVVGGGSGYKNSILFFKAFSQLQSHCGFDIICTGDGGLLEPEFRAYTSGSTVYMLKLDDEELAVAYSGAIALIYPSKYEGFGLPIVEAMACGCPVITCPNGSIPEVAGEAVIYVQDDDMEGMANAICEVQKPIVRHQLINTAFEQIKQFSWSNMAKSMSNILMYAPLASFNLREINLIIFPDWLQDEEILMPDLEKAMKTLISHPQIDNITLLVDISSVDSQDAEVIFSAVMMNMIMREELDTTEKLEISFLKDLSSTQWEALLPYVQAKISLECENQQAIFTAKADNLDEIVAE